MSSKLANGKRIMIVAGEASGDLHAANFVKAAQKLNPDLHFYGIAGSKMQAAGVEVIHDAAELAVMGLIEPLLNYRRLKSVLNHMKELVCKDRPDLLVLIDYPGFNLRLAETAKACGVKVLFYVSPQVWAWRQGRVKKIGKAIDMMAVIFPFEPEFYERFQIPVRYVGHPLVDEVHARMTREEAQKTFGLDHQRRTVGIFPGSRGAEVKHLLPIMLRAASLLKNSHPDVQFILPIAPGVKREVVESYLKASDIDLITVEGQSYDVTQCCDAIMVASGTATLEVAMMGTPMLITYKVASLSYAILRHLIKIPHIGLVNIIAGELVVQEFVQEKAKPVALAKEIAHILDDSDYAQQIRNGLVTVKERLGEGGGSANLAYLALEMLASLPTPIE